jgi:hypothetical protein
MLTSEFILGVVSSLVASLLVVVFKNQLSNLLNVIFLKVYPKIGGRFEILLPEINNAEKQRHILILNQFGGKIWGRIETYSDNKKVSVDKVAGKVTPSRIFIFEFESPPADHHDFGTGLFHISSDNKKMSGYLSSLCANCQNAHSMETTIKKIDDEV